MQRSALLLLIAALVSGCSAMGPATISRDRFDYASAISESWKDQMLLNLVKTRYADVPVFLDIASAINSYSMETGASAQAELPTPLTSHGNTITLGTSGKFTDRPTITYSPLLGEKFSKSLMTPIPPSALWSLLQAGWNAELLLRCCVHSINGLQNYSGRTLVGNAGDPEFGRVVEAIGRIQRVAGVGVRVTREKEGSATFLFFRPKALATNAEDVAEVAKLLGIDPRGGEYKVTYGSIARDDHEVAVLTRSMLEILLDMSTYIDVPSIHVKERRAAPGFRELVPAGESVTPLLHVNATAERPSDAFVAIRYRELWFSIDDRDLSSKGVFSFLMFLFTLTETGGGQVSPILTVPAG